MHDMPQDKALSRKPCIHADVSHEDAVLLWESKQANESLDWREAQCDESIQSFCTPKYVVILSDPWEMCTVWILVSNCQLLHLEGQFSDYVAPAEYAEEDRYWEQRAFQSKRTCWLSHRSSSYPPNTNNVCVSNLYITPVILPYTFQSFLTPHFQLQRKVPLPQLSKVLLKVSCNGYLSKSPQHNCCSCLAISFYTVRFPMWAHNMTLAISIA